MLCAHLLPVVLPSDNFRRHVKPHSFVLFCSYGNLSPINFLEGMHRSKSITWVQSAKFTDERDYDIYIRRLQRFPAQVRSNTASFASISDSSDPTRSIVVIRVKILKTEKKKTQ